jgi:hypothetical protein
MNEKDFRKEKHEARWILTIYKDSVSDSTVFWTTDYEFDGYDAGEISNDGKVFAYVDDWYYENFNIVKIYNQGKKVADFIGKDFNIPPKKLQKTISHYLWKRNINNSLYFEYTNQDVTLVIHTIDNKIHKIDCLKGVLKR